MQLMDYLVVVIKLYTVNLENLARILFSRITLKDIFAMVKIREFGIIYLLQ